MTHGPFILDPHLRRQVWTVIAQRADGTGYTHAILPRQPCYTPAEAVQAAAAMSGIDRKDWNDYVWTATMKGTEP